VKEAEHRAEQLANQLYDLPITSSPAKPLQSYRGPSPFANQSFCD